MIWLVLAYRVLIAITLRSTFSPDEHWQSIEVAHEAVFGYGYLTWEWWDAHRIRSIVHPMIYMFFYEFLSIFNIDYAVIVAYGPRVLQAIFLAGFDICIYKSALLLMGPERAKQALYLSIGSWFISYGGVRTYSNSTEMCLVALAYYFYIQNKMTCLLYTSDAADE